MESQAISYLPKQNTTCGQKLDHCFTNSLYQQDSCANVSESYFQPTPCQNFKFDTSVYETTATEDFHYICENESNKKLSTSLYYAGFGLGGLITGYISDKHGRKPITWICCLLLFISSSLTAYTQTSLQFMICRFFNGFFCNGIMVPAYTLSMENISSKYRGWGSAMFSGIWAVGICIMSIMEIYMKKWPDLQFYTGFLIFPTIVGLFFVPESYK